MTLDPKNEQEHWLALEDLGALIFFDQRLSVNFNQACAACHGRDAGSAGPEMLPNLSGGIYEGSIRHRLGNRKAPSSAYNVFAPLLTFTDGTFVGGNFWDGRATGWRLGLAAADQAQGPFLNPVEQALAGGAIVVERVCHSKYGLLFGLFWGFGACLDSDEGYAAVAYSIAAFEMSAKSSPFRSKFDAYLAGEATLSAAEERGLELFGGDGKCADCHVLDTAPDLDGPLLTDFTYDNIGVPRNVSNPFYRMDDVDIDGQPINSLGFDWIDPGLGGFIEQLASDDGWRSQPHVPKEMLALSSAELSELAKSVWGAHKVPTLRNIALRPFPSFVKSFTHNGYFRTLEGLVHFYNTRDVLATCAGDYPEAMAMALDCWPAPEVAENVNTDEMGDLGLSLAEEADLVAFLETLSDEYEDGP